MEKNLQDEGKSGIRLLTLKTKEGCIRLLMISMVGIFLFSFFGKLFQSDFGKIKVEHVLIDVRGAVMDGQLYYPRGTSSKTKLPAVVVAHGGGMNYGAMRGSALEIARRGFVVLSLSAYGSSLSPMPLYDETGNGVEVFNLRGDNGASAGLFDAVDYVRSMAIVDPTRVGLIGQSMGASRSGAAAVQDCGYLSFNDIMINILYTTFGQEFTEEEIKQNADQLASARLDNEQLKRYNILRDAEWNHFNTRLKAVIVVGLVWLPPLTPSATVNVAGHTVTRNLQTNVGYATGSLDAWRTLNSNETIMKTWYSPQQKITHNSWYALDDNNAKSVIVGDFLKSSVVNDAALRDAIQNKVARVLCEPVPNVTHTGICLSTGLYSQQARFFEQTLGYNRGDLGSASANPLDTSKTLGLWREVCNLIAMLFMFCMSISLGCLLLKTKTFESCVIGVSDGINTVFSKKRFWISAAATVFITGYSIYYTNNKLNGFALADALLGDTFPYGQGTLLGFAFAFFLVIGTIIALAVNAIYDKKTTGKTRLKTLNIGIKFTNILKSISVALIVLCAAYISLGIIDYFFGQDYRYYTVYFSYVRPDYWIRLIPTMLVYFVLYFIIGAGINYTVRDDIPEWKDTIITVVIFSLGIWVLCIFNELVGIHAGKVGTWRSMLVSFMNTYHFNLIVPLVACISRIMYRRTNSLWLGAALSALLVAWASTGSGMNDMFFMQTWLSNFLG